jgi:hypothetical protein
VMGLCEWPQALYLLGRHADAAEFLRQGQADWHSSAATFRQLSERFGLLGNEGEFWSTDDFSWNSRMLYVLCSDDEEFTAEQVLANLPDPEELMQAGVYVSEDGQRIFHPGHFTAETGCVWPALGECFMHRTECGCGGNSLWVVVLRSAGKDRS